MPTAAAERDTPAEDKKVHTDVKKDMLRNKHKYWHRDRY